MSMMTKRKKRSDRNHIVYMLKVRNQAYVGVTVVSNGSIVKSMRRRWLKHVQRAMAEDRAWKLCEAIRKYGAEAFDVEILEVVRGKSQAHTVERDLIRKINPKLNTDIR